jgi:mannosyltransferase
MYPAEARESLRKLFPVVSLTLLAAALRFSFLDRQSFWFDEAVTVQLVRESFTEMLASVPSTESTPPLYYVLAWSWSKTFGTGEVGLRALSALLGAATVPVAYAAGTLLVSRRAGIFTAGLVACSPLLIWYSQEARSYALLALLSALSLLLFRYAWLRPSPRALALWSLVACLALATHYFAVFLIGAEAVWLVIVRRCRVVWVGVGVVAAAGIALLPLALHQESTDQTWWITARPLGDRITEALTQFMMGSYAPPHHIAVLTALAAIGITVGGLIMLAEGHERQGGMIALALGSVAVLGPLALAPTSLDKFLYRNLIGAWVPLAIALAAFLASRRVGRLGLLLITAACAVELASLVVVLNRPTLHRDDWRSAVGALDSSRGPLAVITQPSWERVAIELYRPDIAAMPPAGVAVREIAFLGLSPFPRAFRPPAGFERVEQRRLQHVEIVRYRAAAPRVVTPADLAARGGFGADAVLHTRRRAGRDRPRSGRGGGER